MSIGRGGDIQSELDNAERLLASDAEDTWGWAGPAGSVRVRRRLDFITRAIDARPGRTLLEVGCGTGVFTRGVARTGASIVGVDVAGVLLERARRSLDQAGDLRDVELVCGDVMDPATLEARRFDAFYCVSVLHHLDLDRALPAIARALKPGAAFAVSEPNIENPLNRFWYYRNDDPARRARMGMSATEMAFTKDELAAAFVRNGFVVDEIVHRDFLHPSTPSGLVPLVHAASRFAERLPLVRRSSGSLFARGRLLAAD